MIWSFLPIYSVMTCNMCLTRASTIASSKRVRLRRQKKSKRRGSFLRRCEYVAFQTLCGGNLGLFGSLYTPVLTACSYDPPFSSATLLYHLSLPPSSQATTFAPLILTLCALGFRTAIHTATWVCTYYTVRVGNAHPVRKSLPTFCSTDHLLIICLPSAQCATYSAT